MSRIHSSRKGRAGSHRPYPATAPAWTTATREEIVEEAVKLGKGGLNSAQVGTHLRDSLGVASVRASTGVRLSRLLARREAPEEPSVPGP